MSLADPQTITPTGGSAIPLPRTGDADQGDGSVYTSADGNTKWTVSHSYGKRTRRVFRVDITKISADPFKPDENVERSMSCYLVVDLPEAGFTPAEALTWVQGFLVQLRATSDVMLTKGLGGEH